MENLIENLYVVSEGNIAVSDLPLRMKTNLEKSPLKLAAVERLHIIKVLEIYNHHLKTSADAMGIALNTLKNKIKEYKINVKQV